MFKSILFKFHLLLFGVLVISFFVFWLWLNNQVTNLLTEQSKMVTADDIRTHAQNQLEPESFIIGNAQASSEKYTVFFSDIKTADIVRVKVWDPEYRVVFSDYQPIIGEKFADDNALRSALVGQTVAELHEPTDPENVGEAEFKNMKILEVYVPIYLKDNARPIGVIEVYSKMDAVNALLSKISLSFLLGLLFVTAMVFMLEWPFFWFLVRKRLKLLVRAAHEVAGGNFETEVSVGGEDEIGEYARSFNFMTSKLKDAYEGMELKVRNRTEELVKDNKLMVGRELKMVELKKEIEKLKERIKNCNGNHKED